MAIGFARNRRTCWFGGHCIRLDPYYLTHRAEKACFEPKIILASRGANDAVGKTITRECLRLTEAGGRRPST